MTQEKRLDCLEADLSPRELIIAWMAEAHEFGSYLAYATWLLTQPEDAYPLIGLPRRFHDGIKARMKGKSGQELHAALFAANRDLLFLFHLHSQLNERVMAREQEFRWRTLYLDERMRRSIDRLDAEVDLIRLRKSLGEKQSRPKDKEANPTQGNPPPWKELAADLKEEVLSLVGAATLLSRRYFSGENLLYPECRASLTNALDILHILARLDQLTFGTPAEQARIMANPDEETPAAGPPTASARDLAGELVALARAEALTMLGRQNDGIELVQEWIRAAGS